jgi:hypothetical protein
MRYSNSPGNNQGILVPRADDSARNGISLGSQDNGLMVYDSEISLQAPGDVESLEVISHPSYKASAQRTVYHAVVVGVR